VLLSDSALPVSVSLFVGGMHYAIQQVLQGASFGVTSTRRAAQTSSWLRRRRVEVVCSQKLRKKQRLEEPRNTQQAYVFSDTSIAAETGGHPRVACTPTGAGFRRASRQVFGAHWPCRCRQVDCCQTRC
jgi:hypothetical protein